MRRLDFIRLLVLSLTLFSSGLITGWWLHLRWPPPTVSLHSSKNHPNVILEPLFIPDRSAPLTTTDAPNHLHDFHQSLQDRRNDDAVTLYQRLERNGSPLIHRFRGLLLEQVDLWSQTNQADLAISALERFTDYYYQDIEFLVRLASVYEENRQLDSAVDTYINARTYSSQEDQIVLMSQQIHRLSAKLYEQGRQNLQSLTPLFLKLAYLEPDYPFYRFVLAESYLAATDTESAIRELEMLQFDPDFGDKASQLLAKLLPPPPTEDRDDTPYTVPLSGSGGHYIVNTVVGGQYNVRLLIDTGSSYTTLPTHILKELRKKELATRIAHVELNTANGVRMAPIYRLKEFQIGNYVLTDIDIAELNLGGDSHGLLGMNVLSQFHFFIDQNRHSLSLTPR